MPVGGLAVAVLAEVAPLAGHAREVVLEEDQVAFLDAFALDELLPGLRNHADVLVTHDDRVRNVLLIVLDVAPADPGDLHRGERRFCHFRLLSNSCRENVVIYELGRYIHLLRTTSLYFGAAPLI